MMSNILLYVGIVGWTMIGWGWFCVVSRLNRVIAKRWVANTEFDLHGKERSSFRRSLLAGLFASLGTLSFPAHWLLSFFSFYVFWGLAHLATTLRFATVRWEYNKPEHVERRQHISDLEYQRRKEDMLSNKSREETISVSIRDGGLSDFVTDRKKLIRCRMSVRDRGVGGIDILMKAIANVKNKGGSHWLGLELLINDNWDAMPLHVLREIAYLSSQNGSDNPNLRKKLTSEAESRFARSVIEECRLALQQQGVASQSNTHMTNRFADERWSRVCKMLGGISQHIRSPELLNILRSLPGEYDKIMGIHRHPEGEIHRKRIRKRPVPANRASFEKLRKLIKEL